MNVLIPVFSPPTGTLGSLTRVMALAVKFEKEGHKTAFCASGKIANIIIAKGFHVYPLPETYLLGLPRCLSNRMARKAQNRTPPAREGKSFGNIWLLFCFTGYARKKSLGKIVQTEIKAVKDFQADMLLTEMELGSYLTAKILNIPIITTYANISRKGMGSFFYRRVERTVRQVLRSNGIRTGKELLQLLFGERVLKVIPSIPELDTTPSDAPDVCYAGNMLEPVEIQNNPFEPEVGLNYIFGYFGTGSIPLSKVKTILPEALKSFKNIRCYVASSSIEEEYRIENVYFVRYIQASEILPHCVFTFCHGGLNTITQSLEAGVPLLLFPGSLFERRFNAERVQEAGGGFFGELSDFSSEWITDKLNRSEELKIPPLQQKFKEYHGVETAYSRIIKWIHPERVENEQN